MRPKSERPKPPANLTAAAKAFWASVVDDYQLEDHQVELLAAACFQLTRMEQSRALLAREGLTQLDRFKQSREHPAVKIERTAAATFLALTRELGFDVQPASVLRGPRRPGTRG